MADNCSSKKKKNLFDVLFLNCDWFTLEINGLLDIFRDSVPVAQHNSDLNTMHMETCYYERDLHVIAQELVHLKGAYSRLKLEIYFFSRMSSKTLMTSGKN